MRISKMKAMPPITKLIHTDSWNFWVTGTVQRHESPKSPRMARPHHEMKPGMMPLSMP